MLRAAIIGLGNIAQVHMAVIDACPQAQLVALCDTDPGKKALRPELPFFADLNQMLAQIQPDVLHICLPHYLHLWAAQQAAAAGCHVFCEKPSGLNLKEALQMAGLEQQYHVRTAVCLQNRLNRTTETMRDLLSSGKYGQVSNLRANLAWHRPEAYYRESPWRSWLDKAGGGCLINQALHTMDLMPYLLGSPVIALKAVCGQVLDYANQVEDSATLSLQFANGCPGLLQASVANGQDEAVSFDIQTEGGRILLRQQGVWVDDKDGLRLLASDRPARIGKTCYGDSHALMIERFYRAVETEPLSVLPAQLPEDCRYASAADALEVMLMLEASYRSAATHTRIELEDLYEQTLQEQSAAPAQA
ncbi:MAG: Gfo/Idh/MocA family oxidoreductase [Oscillospiraceae bacterium]|nr:Gfo/Idh/MocA family oxidoreductase [Oscillospiraceae bacterium]